MVVWWLVSFLQDMQAQSKTALRLKVMVMYAYAAACAFWFYHVVLLFLENPFRVN